MRLLIFAVALILCGGGAAHAQEAIGYALVVGSNAPGPGQAALEYAEEDAQEVAALLTELGGFSPSRVRLVQAPTAAALLAEIDALATRIMRDVSAGNTVRLWFYYSGHAKASGLVLGGDELPLEVLRSRLFATKASLTLVVLDACQSGAFSRVKGATPAADFSYNSRSRLDASGVVVLASSTGSELSQESDYLRSSYFTHHLLVALRGAADDNRDGRVSLDEAYRYTYHQTLVSTSSTAVGSQHVSVEVDLKGAGELPLSFPERATSSVRMPAAAEGHALFIRMPGRAVTAEVQKARGAALVVALAPGAYQLLLRGSQAVLRCPFTAAPPEVALSLQRCSREALTPATAKAGQTAYPLRFAVVAGVGSGRSDAYTQRLEDFGYAGNHLIAPHFAMSALHRVHQHVAIGANVNLLGGGLWARDTERAPLEVSWDTYAASAQARIEAGRRFILFAQIGAGAALTREWFHDTSGQVQRESHVGIYADATVGFDVMFHRRFGMTYQLAFSYAPTLPNLLGDRHDTGLSSVGLGLVIQP